MHRKCQTAVLDAALPVVVHPDSERELVQHGRNTAWICEVGTREEWGPFDRFCGAVAAAAADSTLPTHCRHDSSFILRDGVSKSFQVFCQARDGEEGLRQERPLAEALRAGTVRAWLERAEAFYKKG